MAKKPRRSTNFDLQAAGEALYRSALAKSDFSGAASCLRLLKDLEKVPALPVIRGPAHLDVDLFLDDEAEELRQILQSLRELENRVRARIGVALVPISRLMATPIEPPAPPFVRPEQPPVDRPAPALVTLGDQLDESDDYILRVTEGEPA